MGLTSHPTTTDLLPLKSGELGSRLGRGWGLCFDGGMQESSVRIPSTTLKRPAHYSSRVKWSVCSCLRSKHLTLRQLLGPAGWQPRTQDPLLNQGRRGIFDARWDPFFLLYKRTVLFALQFHVRFWKEKVSGVSSQPSWLLKVCLPNHVNKGKIDTCLVLVQGWVHTFVPAKLPTLELWLGVMRCALPSQ